MATLQECYNDWVASQTTLDAAHADHVTKTATFRLARQMMEAALDNVRTAESYRDAAFFLLVQAAMTSTPIASETTPPQSSADMNGKLDRIVNLQEQLLTMLSAQFKPKK